MHSGRRRTTVPPQFVEGCRYGSGKPRSSLLGAVSRTHQLARLDHGRNAVVNVEHVEYRRYVVLDGAFGDLELPGDHLVRQSSRQQSEDFALPLTKEVEALAVRVQQCVSCFRGGLL